MSEVTEVGVYNRYSIIRNVVVLVGSPVLLVLLCHPGIHFLCISVRPVSSEL
jgi:hypothetical protein